MAAKKESRIANATFTKQVELARREIYQDSRRPIEEQKRRVASVMQNELTERQRQLVTMVFSGVSQKEIADRLNLSPSTISRTFNRGMARLRRFLRY